MELNLNYVYILTNIHNTVLYTGVTNDLKRRYKEHCNKKNKSFSSKYNLNKLVYYETFDFIEEAIRREKQIKGLSRKKKVFLIESKNKEWADLLSDTSKANQQDSLPTENVNTEREKE